MAASGSAPVKRRRLRKVEDPAFDKVIDLDDDGPAFMEDSLADSLLESESKTSARYTTSPKLREALSAFYSVPQVFDYTTNKSYKARNTATIKMPHVLKLLRFGL